MTTTQPTMPRQFLRPRTDSDANSSDDDSIGSLPVLERRKSMKRAPRSHPSQRVPRSVVGYNPNRSPARKPSSMAMASDNLSSQSSKSRSSLPPRSPSRRSVSMQPTAPDGNIKRRPSRRKPSSASKSPLPPRHSSGRSTMSPTTPSGHLKRSASYKEHPLARHPHPPTEKVVKTPEKVEDPFVNYPHRRVEPKKPSRALSLPFLRKSEKKKHPKPGDIDFVDRYKIRRIPSIDRQFPDHKMELNHDVWVQRMVLKEGKEPHMFFKSVFSRECLTEPPTGALNIVYMQDMVRLSKDKPAETTPEPQKKPRAKKRTGLTGKWRSSLGFGKKKPLV